jgi:hypothetical protein
MAANRWEWLEGLKPESAISVAVKYMARLIAEELAGWPPAVEITAEQVESRYADLLAPGAPRPSLTAYREAIKRARMELSRDFEAIDHYERNHLLAKACPATRDQLGSEFIQHYILESFFTLMEKTEYRVKRGDVLKGVDQLESLFEQLWLTN